ncbi:MAG: LacI family DNA-binding transcriptional regulator [Ktedonobacteraceae bacterium]
MTENLNKRERTKILHRQLTTSLRERILDGRLPAGTRLPTDHELAAEYQISRDTVRQVLAFLTNEGLIERTQGRGTFVRPLEAITSSVVVAQKPKQIGLLLNRVDTSQDYLDILVGVEQAVKLHDYSVSFNYTERDSDQQIRDIRRMYANQVAGIIIYPVGNATYTEEIRRLQASNFPLIFIDRYLSGLDADYVGTDNRGGGYRATEHLIILGHRHIGFVYLHQETPENTSSVQERLQGYSQALAAYGVPYDPALVVADLYPEHSSIQQSLGAYLQHPDRPSAIFAVNDIAALDVIRAAQALGLRIPQDLAIIGFDDERFASRVNPALTTIAQSFFDIGLRAGTLLVSRIEGLSGPPRHIELAANLIIRESCGAQLHVQRAQTVQ